MLRLIHLLYWQGALRNFLLSGRTMRREERLFTEISVAEDQHFSQKYLKKQSGFFKNKWLKFILDFVHYLSLFPLLFSFVFRLIYFFLVFRFVFRFAFYFDCPPSPIDCRTLLIRVASV